MTKLEMKNFNMPFSSRKIDKYEYLTDEEILFSN